MKSYSTYRNLPPLADGAAEVLRARFSRDGSLNAPIRADLKNLSASA
jgi:hypothetical protein